MVIDGQWISFYTESIRGIDILSRNTSPIWLNFLLILILDEDGAKETIPTIPDVIPKFSISFRIYKSIRYTWLQCENCRHFNLNKKVNFIQANRT